MTSETNLESKQGAMNFLCKVNAVEGFDPTPLAVEYTDLNGGTSRMKLPVSVQIGWFWLKYPEGRITVSVKAERDYFVALARIYHHYTDGPDQYLSEASASRGAHPDKPGVSPREWAQTAAIGIALRNAGFGIQFAAAGDTLEGPAVDELSGIVYSGNPEELVTVPPVAPLREMSETTPSPEPEPEDPFEAALKVSCPIAKHKDKTLGDVLKIEPKALLWVANKFTGNPEISAAAKLICDQALQGVS